MPLNSSTIRAQFPALTTPSPSLPPNFIYGDNAGGSQICLPALAALTDYLVHSNIQMGSDYAPQSTQRCTVLAQEKTAAMFGDGVRREEVVFGGSSTQNLENLGRGLEGRWGKGGGEVIVTGEHEGLFLFFWVVSWCCGR